MVLKTLNLCDFVQQVVFEDGDSQTAESLEQIWKRSFTNSEAIPFTSTTAGKVLVPTNLTQACAKPVVRAVYGEATWYPVTTAFTSFLQALAEWVLLAALAPCWSRYVLSTKVLV